MFSPVSGCHEWHRLGVGLRHRVRTLRPPIIFTLLTSLAHKRPAIGTRPDYDLGPGQNGEHIPLLDRRLLTTLPAIDRTQAWHQIHHLLPAHALTLRIGGTLIYTGLGASRWNRVEMYLGASILASRLERPIDDFQSPSGPGLDVHMYADSLYLAQLAEPMRFKFQPNLNGSQLANAADITCPTALASTSTPNSPSAPKRF